MEKIVHKNIRLVKKYDGRVYFSLNGNEKELANWAEFNNSGKKLPFTKDTIMVDLIGENKIDPKNNKPKFQIKAIEVEGNLYKREVAQAVKKIDPLPKTGKDNNKGVFMPTNNKSTATAPYNFVPLNEEIVIPSENAEPKFDKFQGISGYIDIKLTAITPIYTKGIGHDFFKINDKYGIPGSTIRGMLRSLLEIISFGKFVSFKDRHIYERKSGQSASNNRKIGFLKFNKDEGKYEIFPTKAEPLRSRSTEKNEFTYEFESNKYLKIWSGMMTAGNVLNFKVKYEKISQVPLTVEDDIIKSYMDDDSREVGRDIEILLDLAKNPNKKYETGKPSFQQRINTYNRNNPTDEIEFIGIPVWYIQSGNEIKSFGHCKNYRVPFAHSIGGHIPKILQNEEVVDITEGIFGRVYDKKILAGKVFFEDAQVIDGAFVKTETSFLQILSNPKPKSAKLYLEQYEENKTVNDRGNKTWNSPPPNNNLRGYKMYWHRNSNDAEKSIDGNNWRKTHFDEKQCESLGLEKKEQELYFENSPNKEAITQRLNDNKKIQFKLITALDSGTKFESRIRFENFSKVELGALLFILNLPSNCYHKIGMGKPLGLGSIHIEIGKIVEIRRQARYSSIFEASGSWELAEIEIKDKTEYEIAFKNYLNTYLKGSDLWQNERLNLLKTLLTFDEKKVASESWLNQTRYMKWELLRNSSTLPKPTEV